MYERQSVERKTDEGANDAQVLWSSDDPVVWGVDWASGHDFTVTHIAIYGERPKTFRERWFSWPWRPWQKTVPELMWVHTVD